MIRSLSVVLFLLVIFLQPRSAIGRTKLFKLTNTINNISSTEYHVSSLPSPSAAKDIGLTKLYHQVLTRTRRSRHLQQQFEGFNFNADELGAAELGFLAGVAFLVALVAILICICCCCCCSGGAGARAGGTGCCNLWDIVALVCLWDLCCDRRSDDCCTSGTGDCCSPGEFTLV